MSRNQREIKEKLWKCFRLKETKGTCQLNTIHDPRLSVPEGDSDIKDIMESTHKNGIHIHGGS